MSSSPEHPQRRTLRSNFMSAFDLSFAPGTPESHSTIGMPDGPDAEELMLPTVEDGLFDHGRGQSQQPPFARRHVLAAAARDSGATVISTASADEDAGPSPPTYITTGRSKKRGRSSKPPSGRRASPPSRTSARPGDSVGAQSVPEFLCHLHTMLADRSIDRLISWEVPEEDEDEPSGGGIGGVGKIVVHRPEELQDTVLGNYYRHSRYASFQRQLNYFGFKKRLHGGKKGKLSPCSYIHEGVTDDARSLFDLKRRPPARKRTAGEAGLVDGPTVEDERAHKTPSGGRSSGGKGRRGPNAGPARSGPSSSASRSRSKGKAGGRTGPKGRRSSSAGRQEKRQEAAPAAVPVKVVATEYGAPSRESTGAIRDNHYYPKSSAASTLIPNVVPPAEPSVRPAAEVRPQQPPKTLADLLSTYLPPASLLFDDDLDGGLVEVSPSGFCYHHKVSSAMVDLATVPEV